MTPGKCVDIVCTCWSTRVKVDVVQHLDGDNTSSARQVSIARFESPRSWPKSDSLGPRHGDRKGLRRPIDPSVRDYCSDLYASKYLALEAFFPCYLG